MIRLFLALAYLGGLFLAGGYVYRHVQRFDGELCVGKGRVENVAARPAGAGGIRPMERNLAIDVIPFKDMNAARRHFDADGQYDTATLPFSLRLEDVVILEQLPPREVLEVQAGRDKAEYPAKAGTAITLDGEEVAVLELRPWTGLIRNAQGRPAASLSLRRPGEAWMPRILLEVNRWQSVGEAMAIRFAWFESESAARDLLPNVLTGLETARWGVREGESVHWVSSFAPGTAIKLSGGEEVTLLQADLSHEGKQPAILLRAQKPGGEEEGWVNANGTSRDGSILFEYPTAAKSVVFLHAWRDGAALMASFDSGNASGVREMKEHDSWMPEGSAYELRLDQVMAAALPMHETEMPLREAVLRTAEGEMAVREGESQAYKGARIAFRRIATPPRVRYQFAVLPEGGGKGSGQTLSPGDSLRIGEWRFRQVESNPDAATMAVLRAERSLGGAGKLIGATLFMAGSIGWVLLMYRFRWRKS